jgi:hypothetical protein
MVGRRNGRCQFECFGARRVHGGKSTQAPR